VLLLPPAGPAERATELGEAGAPVAHIGQLTAQPLELGMSGLRAMTTVRCKGASICEWRQTEGPGGQDSAHTGPLSRRFALLILFGDCNASLRHSTIEIWIRAAKGMKRRTRKRETTGNCQHGPWRNEGSGPVAVLRQHRTDDKGREMDRRVGRGHSLRGG